MANILGINTGQYTKREVLDRISDFYKSKASHYLVTPNPEIILKAQEDEELFFILNKADISIADGFGLKLAAALSKQSLNRYTGADLLPALLKEASHARRRVLIINWQDGLSSDADLIGALERYGGIKYLIINEARVNSPNENNLKRIKDFAPELAICLLGSPYQEKYVYHLSRNLESLKLALGLGGAFDFLSGKAKRAPRILHFLGLEWFWRLIFQPSRLPRIWRATIVFLSKFINWAYVLPLKYRKNVAILLFRQGSEGREILILEREDEDNHWQVPQGGLDHSSIESAARRELEEETGLMDYQVLGVYKNLYKYKFQDNLNNNTKFKTNFRGYKGQKQSLAIIELLASHKGVKVNYWDHQNFAWVREEDFIKKLHPIRREAARKFIKKYNKLLGANIS